MRYLFFLVALLGCSSSPQCIKEEIKRNPGSVYDNCAYFRKPIDDPLYVWTSEGIILVNWGETKIFSLDLEKDEYSKTGGWYWRLGETGSIKPVEFQNLIQRTCIKETTRIKVVRDKKGNIEWQPLNKELKND